jgi:hypothetical protein
MSIAVAAVRIAKHAGNVNDFLSMGRISVLRATAPIHPYLDENFGSCFQFSALQTTPKPFLPG